jgi:hypothetical protein
MFTNIKQSWLINPDRRENPVIAKNEQCQIWNDSGKTTWVMITKHSFLIKTMRFFDIIFYHVKHVQDHL